MSDQRVKVIATGETGRITKSIGNCLWVRMDDGRELSGAKKYFKKVKERR